MEKRIALLLAMLIAVSAFVLAGCNNDGAKPTGGNVASTEGQKTVEETVPTEEPWPERKMRLSSCSSG